MRPSHLSVVILAALAGCDPDNGLTKFNSEPAAAITSPAEGDEVRVGTALALRGSASDANHIAADLTARWFLDDVELCAGTPAADGATVCDVTVPEAEALTVRLEVTDPEGAAASDSVSLTVTPDVTPTATITSPTADGVYYSDQLVTLSATVEDAEDAEDTLTVRWESSVDGDLGSPSPSSEGLVESFVNLSEGQHALQVFVTDSGGNEGQASVIVDVGPPNTAPTCAITAPADGSAGEAGTAVIFRGTSTDPDVPEDWLTVTWTSDKDGTLGTSTPASDGSVIFSFDGLSADTHVVSMQVADELGATCTAQILYTAGSAPTISLESPTPGQIVAEGDALVFGALVSDGEDAPGDLLVAWETSIDGLLYEGPPDSTGVAQFIESELTVGEHVLTVTVTDSTGLYATALGTFTVDGTPTAPVVSLTPASPATDDDLVVSIDSPAVDPEGASLTYGYAWSVDGVPSTASVSATLPASATSRGESWTVSVTATDGLTTSTAGTASVTISNTDPVTTVSLTPGAPTRADTLTCSAVATDVDGDALTYAFTWTVDGVVVPATSTSGPTSTLSASFGVDDVVTCDVLVSDGSGSASASTSVTVGNTAPTASVALSPTTVRTDDTLVATVTSADADGDTLSTSYAWTVDGVAVASTGATLSGAEFDRDAIVEVVVAVSDGADVTTATARVTVSNTPPDAPAVAITPASPHVSDDLLCSVATAASDADGDAVSYVVSWTVDGVAFSGAGTTTLAGDTIDSADTAAGDLWTCSVLPTDGTDSGTVATAAVTVGAEFIGWSSASVALASADYKLYGQASGDSASSGMGVGDVDQDGLSDFVIGSRQNDTGGTDAGTLYVVTGGSLGSSARMSLSTATYRFSGEASGDILTGGAGGDVDGDGVPDLMLASRDNDDAGTDWGKVYIFRGSGISAGATSASTADYWLTGESAAEFSEFGAGGLGDLDGDGLGDVFVGASRDDDGGVDAGKIFIALGSSLPTISGGTLGSADITLVGENAGDGAGSAGGVGDLDGDGLQDLVISASGSDRGGSNAGALYIVYAASIGSSPFDLSGADGVVVGESAGDATSSFTALPDTDGDGYPDLLVGSGYNDRGGTDAGTSYFFSGTSLVGTVDASAADLIFVGGAAGDYAGISLGISAGDVDGDGLTDLFIGAQGANGGGSDAGAAYLLLASGLAGSGTYTVTSAADYTFVGESSGDNAGTSLSVIGDVNGDGLDDLTVGAYRDDDGGTNAGAGYVLLAP